MNNEPRMSKKHRKALAAYRKGAMVAGGHTYADLARLAAVTYSMADKWMNARRDSERCSRAFRTLTGQPATNEVAA